MITRRLPKIAKKMTTDTATIVKISRRVDVQLEAEAFEFKLFELEEEGESVDEIADEVNWGDGWSAGSGSWSRSSNESNVDRFTSFIKVSKGGDERRRRRDCDWSSGGESACICSSPANEEEDSSGWEATLSWGEYEATELDDNPTEVGPDWRAAANGSTGAGSWESAEGNMDDEAASPFDDTETGDSSEGEGNEASAS